MVEDKNAECEAPPLKTNKIELHMYPLNPDGSWRDGQGPPKPRPKSGPPLLTMRSFEIELDGNPGAALARLQDLLDVKSLRLNEDRTLTTTGLKRVAVAELIARQSDRHDPLTAVIIEDDSSSLSEEPTQGEHDS